MTLKVRIDVIGLMKKALLIVDLYIFEFLHIFFCHIQCLFTHKLHKRIQKEKKKKKQMNIVTIYENTPLITPIYVYIYNIDMGYSMIG